MSNSKFAAAAAASSSEVSEVSDASASVAIATNSTKNKNKKNKKNAEFNLLLDNTLMNHYKQIIELLKITANYKPKSNKTTKEHVYTLTALKNFIDAYNLPSYYNTDVLDILLNIIQRSYLSAIYCKKSHPSCIESLTLAMLLLNRYLRRSEKARIYFINNNGAQYLCDRLAELHTEKFPETFETISKYRINVINAICGVSMMKQKNEIICVKTGMLRYLNKSTYSDNPIEVEAAINTMLNLSFGESDVRHYFKDECIENTIVRILKSYEGKTRLFTLELLTHYCGSTATANATLDAGVLVPLKEIIEKQIDENVDFVDSDEYNAILCLFQDLCSNATNFVDAMVRDGFLSTVSDKMLSNQSSYFTKTNVVECLNILLDNILDDAIDNPDSARKQFNYIYPLFRTFTHRQLIEIQNKFGLLTEHLEKDHIPETDSEPESETETSSSSESEGVADDEVEVEVNDNNNDDDTRETTNQMTNSAVEAVVNPLESRVGTVQPSTIRLNDILEQLKTLTIEVSHIMSNSTSI